MSREAAIASAEAYFDSGAFKTDLARRVAIPTESQNPERVAELKRYIETEIRPALEAMGFICRVLTQGQARGPFLYADPFQDKATPTLLGSGHGGAGGRPPFRQLGRAPVEPCDPARTRNRLHRRADRPDSHPRMGARRYPRLGTPRSC